MTAVSSVQPNATTRQWMAIAGVILGVFVAILDTTIINSSLQDIQGSLSATLSEGSWISTSYLVTEIIVIPLTAYFCRVFSTRRYLLTNVVVFLIFSCLCGLARSLGAMIAFRALQGFAGGALIPVAVTVIVTTLPARQQSIGFVLFGLATTFAPAIGPSLGGWITSHFGWPFIFYVNLLPGVPLLYLIYNYIDAEPMHLNELRTGDWWGIAAISTFLGTLTTVLEEGNREDWLSSSYIFRLAALCLFSFLAFIAIELLGKRPVVNLRLFARPNFLFACVMSFALGVAIYAPNYISPIFLGSVLGYDSLAIGKVMMWMGPPQLLVMAFIPKLMEKVDARILLGIGYAIMGASLLMNSPLCLNFGEASFALCLVVRSIAVPFIITPSTALSYEGIEPENIGSASGLSNMTRNLGGSVGLGLIGTVISRRGSFHFSRLAESFSYTNAASVQRLKDLTASFVGKGSSPAMAHDQAIQSMNGILNREANIMAMADGFYLMGVMMIACIALLFFMKKPSGAASGPAH